MSRLLDIIINSLYTQKEIFLREAISNASDALDKVRFLSIQDDTVLSEESEMEIKITANPDEEMLIIRDTGIGMSREDLINNLGTIARSGTTQFLQAITQSGNLNLIGQFGVGFYSYFLVAKQVEVISKKQGHEQFRWISTAGSTFTIAPDTDGERLTRGTKIILRLKKDMKEYAEIGKIKELIIKYSQFINFPIYLYTSKEVSREVEEEPAVEPQDEGEEEKPETPEDLKDDLEEPTDELEIKEDGDEDVLEPEKKKKVVKETVWDWERVNDSKAIWLRPSDEIEDEEYKKFYKTMSKDYQDPLSWIHFKTEG